MLFSVLNWTPAYRLQKNVESGSTPGAQGALLLGANINSIPEKSLAQANVEIMEFLIRKGLTVACLGHRDFLWLVLLNENYSLAEYLIKNHGVKVDQRLSQQTTVLMQASGYGQAEMVKLLLDHDARVNLQDQDGQSALMRAVCNESPNYHLIVSLLLKAGAQVNMQDHRGETALSVAVTKGRVNEVRLLLKHGTDINLQDNTGSTVLMKAVNFYDPIWDEKSRTAHDERKSLILVRTLLENGAKVDIRNGKGRSALMMASKNGDVDCVGILLAYRSEVGLQDKEGRSALQDAREREREGGNGEVVRLLLESGAKA